MTDDDMTDGEAPKRLLVIGAGAVGGAIGGLLHSSGFPVVLVARGPHGAALRRDGLTLRTPARSLRAQLPSVSRISGLRPRPGDLALLATKLQDAEAAMDELLAVAGPTLPIVCAVNGVDGERWAAQRFHSVASMLVWIPALHLVPGEVRIYGAPCPAVLDVGLYPSGDAPWIDDLCDRLRGAGFDALPRRDIWPWKLAKWITNLGSAAQALITDDWLTVALAARAEGEQVLDAAGLEHVSQDELLARTKAVGPAMIDGEHRPGGSTWQSRAQGKPLESLWIEGAMAALGRRVGVETPVLDALTLAAKRPRPLLAADLLRS